MKPLLVLFIPSAFTLFAAEPDMKALLQKGLVAEEADGDLTAAAQAYEELVKAGDAQQKLIATALFRLAEVKRKQNQNDEAAKLYQRVVAEFGTQEALVKLARENLTAQGQPMTDKPAAGPVVDPLAQAKRSLADLMIERKHLLTKMKPAHPEVKLIEERIARAQDLVDQLDEGPESAEIARMEKLLRESPDRAKQEFPLHLAAMKGWARLATAMLKRGFEVNRSCYPGDGEGNAELKRWSGYPPLSVAAAEGNKAVAEALIQGGARLDIDLTETGENSSILNPLWIAIGRGRLEIVKLLLKQKINPAGRACITSTPWGAVFGTALAKAVNTADIAPEVVTLFLEAGFDAGESLIVGSDEQKPEPGKTLPLLSLACSTGRAKSVEVLIGAGAHVNAVGADGQTPLFHTGSNDQIAALLIEHGADITIRDKSGATPLLKLLAYPSVLRLLLAKGADPKATDNEGRTALHLCARQGIADHAVYELLLSLPMDPSQKDKAGKTALEYALEWHQGQRYSNQPPPDFDLYLTARTKTATKGVYQYARTASPDELLTSIYTPMSDAEPLPTLAEFLVLMNHYSPESRWRPSAQPGMIPLQPQGTGNRPTAPMNPRRLLNSPVPGVPGGRPSSLAVMHLRGADAQAKAADLVTFLPNFKSTDEALFQPMKAGEAVAVNDPSQTWIDVQRQLPERMRLGITVRFHGIEREFAIGESDPWHPIHHSLPFGYWDEVLEPFTRDTLPLDMTKVKIVRMINGKEFEKVINVQAGRPSSWPRPMNGDRVELISLPDDRKKIILLLPDTGYAKTMVPDANAKTHLCNLLVMAQSSQAGNSGFPLGRDWSRVLIYRQGQKEPIVYDLAKVEAVVGENQTANESAEADPVLEPGDRVELPPLKDRPDAPAPKGIESYIRKVGGILPTQPMLRRRAENPPAKSQ